MPLLPTSHRAAWNATLASTAALTALRLAAASTVGLGTDEAHYALYGSHPALSYFDHPPLTGWLQALVLATVGDSDRALRLMPILLMALAALLAHRLARRLFPEAQPAAAWVAALAVLLCPMTQGLGLAMVPEVPLLVTGLACALALARLLPRPTLGGWLWLGLWLGLAGLSKYTAVTLAVGCLAAVLLRHGWRCLAAPGPWLAAALCLGLLAPVWIWNLEHDWLSIRYQLDHGTGGDRWSPVDALVSQLGQLLAFTPLLVLWGWRLLLRGWPRRDHDGVLVSLCLTAPTAALFVYGSGYERSLPHWWTLVWVLLAPLVAHDLLAGPLGQGARRLALGSLAWALLLLVAIHGELLLPWMPIDDGRHPVGELTGWDAAAARASALADEMQDCAEPQLFSDHWSRASRLAWYARPRPVIVLDGRFDQFDLWFGSPRTGSCGVLVTHDEDPADGDPSDLRRFARHELADQLDVRRGGRLVGRFRFWTCHDHLPR